jgi:hypothetical protein
LAKSAQLLERKGEGRSLFCKERKRMKEESVSDWKERAGNLLVLEELRRRVKRMAEEQDCGQETGEIESLGRLREQSVRITVTLHS